VYKKYKYNMLLFNTLYSLANKQDAEAVELLLRYLKDEDRRGFAAEALGRLKEKRAVGIIVKILKDSLKFSPELITFKDAFDNMTLSSYVYMIRALKLIDEAEPGVLNILEDYSTKVKDKEVSRDAKEAFDSLCPDTNYTANLNHDLNPEKNLLNETIEKSTEKKLRPVGEKSAKKRINIEVTLPEKLSQEKEYLIKSCKERNQYSLKHRRSTAVYKYMNRF
jgi:hypothetical protein